VHVKLFFDELDGMWLETGTQAVAAVRCSANAICPAWVNTTFGRQWMGDLANTDRVSAEAKIQVIVNSYPQKRLIVPDEIGNLALFLALDESFGVSGQDVTISGAALW
jgi:3-hydroxybutyrate dehydrogenase